jgi:hypothetical protein
MIVLSKQQIIILHSQLITETGGSDVIREPRWADTPVRQVSEQRFIGKRLPSYFRCCFEDV